MIKACIFDLDGVIVDTARYHFLSWQRLAKELGVNLTEHENENLKGVGRMRSLELIMEMGHVHLSEEEKERLAAKKNVWFVEYVDTMKPDEIFPGVRDLILKIKAAGMKVALASSSRNAAKVIRLLKLEDVFDVMVDGTMITHSKPDPEIFLQAASKLNLPPQACLVFEDAAAGVEAALTAGMKCVGVGSSAQLGKANRIVKTTGDFKLEYINSL